MDTDSKSKAFDPWETDQITERLPAWEIWEDGVEPEDEAQPPKQSERAA